MMNISKEILWEKCLSKIKLEIPPESYATWFEPTSPHSLSEETLFILIPNNFYKECLQQNYNDLIKSALNSLVSTPLKIDFKVAPEKPEQKKIPKVVKTNESTVNKYTQLTKINRYNKTLLITRLQLYMVSISCTFVPLMYSSTSTTTTLD